MSDPTPAPTPTDEQAFEDRAMRQRTSLTNPSPLLLRVRQHVRDHGGDGKAFDWAVNDHVRAALGRVSAAAPDDHTCYSDECGEPCQSWQAMKRAEIELLRRENNKLARRLGEARAALAARPAPTHECEQEYGTDRDGCVVGPLPCRHPEHTRPAPVVSEEVEWGVRCPLDGEVDTTWAEGWDDLVRVRAHHNRNCGPGHIVVRRTVTRWTTVADAPAADDEGGRE